MKQLLQGTLIALLICVVQLQAISHTTQNNQQECNITGKSKLYQEWAEQWKGKYETDIYYHQTGTSSAIKDMLEQCDIRGLTLILNDIGTREFILH